MLDEIDSVDSVLDKMDLVEDVDEDGRSVGAAAEGLLDVTVVKELVEVVLGDVLDKDDG